MQTDALPRRLLLTFCLALPLFSARLARADGPAAPAPPSADVPQASDTDARLGVMDREMTIFAERAREQRHTTLVTGLVGAAALVPAGYVLSQRSDATAQSIGFGMELSGVVPLAFSAFSLAPSRMERLRGQLEDGLAEREPRVDLLRRMEAEWAQAADAGRSRRLVLGVVGTVLGGACTAAGIFFLVADPVAGLTRDQQYNVGALLVGPGTPLLAMGIRAFLGESVEETSWDAYRAATGAVGTATAATNHVAVSAAPTRGGGVAALAYTF